MTNKLSYTQLPVFLSGLIDGIIVPLSVYAFFSRVLPTHENTMLITAVGGSALALILAAGAYFTRRSEIENATDSKILKIYENLDISDAIREEMTSDTVRENEQWQKKWNGESNITEGLSPAIYAAIIGSGYVAGLLVVLINGWMHLSENLGFLILPVIVLAIAAFIKFTLAGQKPLAGVTMILVSCLLAVLSNWWIAGFF